MQFNSYAQNFEDVMLWRALKLVGEGFYIDVGAAGPWEDSVTAAFYERGWRGVNIEPQQAYFKRMVAARPKDINLDVLIGAAAGRQSFYEVYSHFGDAITGLSTKIKNVADRHRNSGFKIVERPLEVQTLGEICDRYAPREIHFLKIDVEGAEREALMGMNFYRHRPWIVVVEATEPNSPLPSHEQWEKILLHSNYRFVWFDGLNRFYLSSEKYDKLKDHFNLPPNVFDGFRRGRSPAFSNTPVLAPDPFIANAPTKITDDNRIAMTTACRDADAIPKIPGAGSVITDRDGQRVQLMHNGLKVVADGYCGPWMTRLIESCEGHHEPQEERIFHEVVKRLAANATMIELGGNWSYYTMWFLKDAPRRRAIIVEPDPANRAVGEANLALNDLSATFVAAFAGAEIAELIPFQTERSGVLSLRRTTVEELMRSNGIDRLSVLHCDIQGAELTVIDSCKELLANGRIDWIFISTHAYNITGDPLTHQRCLSLLQASGAKIVAEHDVHEFYSGDGLIVARFTPEFEDWSSLSLSRNRYSSSFFRNPIYDFAAEIRRRHGVPHEDIAAIVDAAYRAILMRPAEIGGLTSKTNALAEGKLNVENMLKSMLNSRELKLKRAAFQTRYFGDSAVESYVHYLQGNNLFECTGFRLKLRADCSLGSAGTSILTPIDDVILPGLFKSGSHQKENLQLAAQSLDLSQSYSLLDIGANIGLFSSQLLVAFPNIERCIGVEPDPDNFAALEYNLRPFDGRSLQLHNFAITDSDGEALLYRDPQNCGNYSLSADAVEGNKADQRRVRTVDARGFANRYLPDFGPLILKTDTQGWDETIITRFPRQLWDRVILACIEIWRISKPPFDAGQLKEIIELFPNRFFQGETNGDVDDILNYAIGKDRKFQDLILWR